MRSYLHGVGDEKADEQQSQSLFYIGARRNGRMCVCLSEEVLEKQEAKRKVMLVLMRIIRRRCARWKSTVVYVLRVGMLGCIRGKRMVLQSRRSS